MFRHVWLIVAVAGVLLLLGVVVVVGIGLLFGRQQTISAATSPDGTWSVEVLARPHALTGSYDIIIEVRDGQGQKVGGGSVVGLTRDLASARRAHAVSFVDNNTAKVGKRTINKPSLIRQ
jgi:hypothetical protein